MDTLIQVESENQEDTSVKVPLERRTRAVGIVGDSDESAGKRRMKSTRKDTEGVSSSITSVRTEGRMDWRRTVGDGG